MLVGVALEQVLVAVVALGITADGTKTLLDFELGAAESEEVAKALLERLKRRGFAPAEGCRLLSVLDGAVALLRAVSAHFPGTAFQRCLVHKERNLRRYVRWQDWAELSLRSPAKGQRERSGAGSTVGTGPLSFGSERGGAGEPSGRRGGPGGFAWAERALDLESEPPFDQPDRKSVPEYAAQGTPCVPVAEGHELTC